MLKTMKDHAIEYARWGFQVFPLWWAIDGVCQCDKGILCDRVAKHPYAKLAPNGLKNATSNESVVDEWWTKAPMANIAIATGPDSGLVVVDADGPEGAMTLQEYDIPETPKVKTGRADGGYHLWFLHPGEFIKSTRILPGVDTRADGGYVCFTAGHKVVRKPKQPQSKHTTLVDISQIIPGDVLIGYDEIAGTPVETLVREVGVREVQETLIIKFGARRGTLRLTPEHPLYTTRGWVAAGDLQIGDELFHVPRTFAGLQEQTYKQPKGWRPSRTVNYAERPYHQRVPSHRHRRSRYEDFVQSVAHDAGIDLRFVGDGSLVVRHNGYSLQPDFLIADTSKLVEVSTDVYKNGPSKVPGTYTRNLTREQRCDLLRQAGYDVLYFDATDWSRGYDSNTLVVTDQVRKALVEFAGNGERIEFIHRVIEPVSVYNIHCDPHHNYFVRRIGPMSDLLLAHNCVPPNVHASGNVYEWLTPLESVRLAKTPDWVIKLAGADSKRRKHNEDEDPNDEPELITEARNIWLTTQAGHLRRVGLREEALLTSLRDINDQRCSPPLPDDEVQRISKNAMKWEPEADPQPNLGIIDPDDADGDQDARINELPEILHRAKLTDSGNAECFVNMFGERYKYVPDQSKWFRWVGSHWQEDVSGAATRAMLYVVRSRFAASARIPDKTTRKSFRAHCDRSENAGKLQAALSVSGVLPGMSLRAYEFDADPWILGTPGGIIDLKNQTLIEADPSYRITRLTEAAYTPDAKCPLWLQTINDIFEDDQELIDYIQRAMGYCLSGDMREQAFFVCYGKGANGKSTFLGLVRQLLGDYAATVPFESFDADQRNGLGNDIAALRGKRFVVCIEAEHSRKLAEAKIKSITGGDRITCRFLFNEFFSYDPQFKLWLAVNHRPIIRGDDYGIWRRIHLIPFNRRFEGALDNKQLREQLMEELPGILNWLVEGLKKWQERGLERPTKVAHATEQYREESDQVGRWMKEQVVRSPNNECVTSKAYAAYRAWALDNGERAFSSTIWLHRLSDHGIAEAQFNNMLVLKGMRLQANAADVSDIHSFAEREVA